jgi:peptidoglycan hydrolase-like protein with peptidoglycan-binding domain
MAAMTTVEVQADPAGVVAIRAKVIEAAKSVLGRPYVEGGLTPEQGFDCEGLVVWCFAQAGITIRQGSATQFTTTGPVTRGLAVPGMLVFLFGGETRPPRPGHVGIVTGPGKMIDAPYTGVDVRYDSFSTMTTIGPMDFYGFTDPAKFLSSPAPLPPPATLVDVKLRVLSEGCKGYDVQSLQILLNHVPEIHLDIDSIFGPLTKSAVEVYQKHLGYKVDGVVGAATWRSILGAPNP